MRPIAGRMLQPVVQPLTVVRERRRGYLFKVKGAGPSVKIGVVGAATVAKAIVAVLGKVMPNNGPEVIFLNSTLWNSPCRRVTGPAEIWGRPVTTVTKRMYVPSGRGIRLASLISMERVLPSAESLTLTLAAPLVGFAANSIFEPA